MAGKAKILVLGTGGTIAGAGQSATTATYKAGQIDASRLIAGIAQLDRLAEVRAETLYAKPSGDLGPAEWLALARRVQAALDAGEADGVVVTHGTDTLEEAAFFLGLLLKTDKPVVFTAAMRPATALGADGPANLFQAVRVAAAPDSAERGVLVVMNDTVLPGWMAVKTASLPVQAFRAYPGGPLGRVTGERLTWFEPPRRSPLAGRFVSRLGGQGDLPAVGIVIVHGGCGAAPLAACRDAGYPGVVIAGFGGGTMPAPMAELARKMAKDGTAIVVSSRVGDVAVMPEVMDLREDADIVAASGFLNPQKSALLLSLALAEGRKAAEIPALFGCLPAGLGDSYGSCL
ncbi:asparaginase [Shumkonia mesophila]|uniref:asparaginase n=1 Tax=Shumkonia mesophila TaxID=2838854 RepID=UPI0029348B9F|nr:asparaginase [Shumkonia mesophila]